MSDANIPPKDPGSSESSYSTYSEQLAQESVPPEQGDADSDSSEFVTPDWEDWQTVHFPNALNIEGLERQSLDARAVDPDIEDPVEPDWQHQSQAQVQSDQSDEALVEQSFDQNPDSSDRSVIAAQVAELLTLVRDLNQCNDALLSRVRHLEEEFAACQNALQIEVARSREQAQQLNQNEQVLHQRHEALLAAQTQITQLTNEVEFARQTAQRHEIRIETLNDQIETGQQRIAQLERECTLIQQRYQEQTLVLQEANNTCRDLRSRLQRQQRYTLQFKAALEKCLDVPPPQYQTAVGNEKENSELVASSENLLAVNAPMLPRIQQIKPWSDGAPVTAHPFKWVPPSALVDADIAEPDSDMAAEQSPTDESQLEQPELFSVPEDPEVLLAETTDTAASDPALVRPSISYDVKHPSSPLEAPMPAQEEVPVEETDHQETRFELTAHQELLEEAEDALWQDLARLIDASGDASVEVQDDVTFEPELPAISSPTASSLENTVEAPSPVEDSPSPPAGETFTVSERLQSPPRTQPVPAETVGIDDQPAKESSADSQRWVGDFTIQSSWPSPVVYPLRPQKRRKSMAAVELPSFPRRQG